MNENLKKLYEGITNIDDDLIETAYNYKEKINPRTIMKRIVAVAACLCLCATASLPVMAASGNDKAYDMLYKVSPVIAQKLKPVNETCESKGIRMEVESAYIEGPEAEILVSFTDVERNRIDETLDMFDSYRINNPHDSVKGCTFHSYDNETGKATFLISIENDNGKNIEGEKVTFSVSRLLIGKNEKKCELTMIDMTSLEEVTELYNPEKYGSACSAKWENWDSEDQLVLIPNQDASVEICEGVTFTGAGIIDGDLHIQIKYDDVYHTDNHGFISLKDSEGNVVECERSVAFKDTQDINGYEEYLFDIPAEKLNDYIVYGEFVSSGGLIEGDWEITFPVNPDINTSDGN